MNIVKELRRDWGDAPREHRRAFVEAEAANEIERLRSLLREMVLSAPHSMKGTERFNKAWRAAKVELRN
jgi:hypothetical protein